MYRCRGRCASDEEGRDVKSDIKDLILYTKKLNREKGVDVLWGKISDRQPFTHKYALLVIITPTKDYINKATVAVKIFKVVYFVL